MELPGLGLDYDLVVGTSEKHHVVYHWGQLSGLTRISVDGVEVLKKHRMFDFFRTKWRCEVSIGKIEVHRFGVEQRILWFWGGAQTVPTCGPPEALCPWCSSLALMRIESAFIADHAEVNPATRTLDARSEFQSSIRVPKLPFRHVLALALVIQVASDDYGRPFTLGIDVDRVDELPVMLHQDFSFEIPPWDACGGQGQPPLPVRLLLAGRLLRRPSSAAIPRFPRFLRNQLHQGYGTPAESDSSRCSPSSASRSADSASPAQHGPGRSDPSDSGLVRVRTSTGPSSITGRPGEIWATRRLALSRTWRSSGLP